MNEETITGLKCPSCGASIEHTYNHRCPYCRTFLKITDFNVEEYNNKHLSNFEVREIDLEQLTYSISIIISAYTDNIYGVTEYGKNENFIAQYDNNQKKIYFKFLIPLNLIRENPQNLIEIIIHSLPPNLRNYEYEIIDKIIEFSKTNNTTISRFMHGF